MGFRLRAMVQIKTVRGTACRDHRHCPEPRMGRLMFSCTETGREFDSGFRSTPVELGQIPPDYQMNVMCSVCYRLHPVTVSQARISDESTGSAS